MHELVLTKQVCSEMGPSALMGIHLEQMKPCSETGSYIPNTVKNYIYLNFFPFTCKDTTFCYFKNTHLPLKSGWLGFGRQKLVRKGSGCICTLTECGGGSWGGWGLRGKAGM